MNSQIIAIESAENIKNILNDKMYVEKDGTVLIHADSTDHATILKDLQQMGVIACSYSQYDKLLNTKQRHIPFREYDATTVYDWQKCGCEYFGVVHSDEFDLCSIENKQVNIVAQVEPVNDVFISRTGAILTFVRNLTVSFHVNETLDKIFDVKAPEAIEKVVFDSTDCFVGIVMASIVYVYDLKIGLQLYEFKKQLFDFAKGRLYVGEVDYPLEKGNVIKVTGSKKNFTKSHKNKCAHFVDGKIQKIIFDNSKTIQSKNHNNIVDVKFYFSTDKLYAIIIKRLGKVEQYIIEIYTGTEITMNSLEHNPLHVTVSDNYFVVFDSSYNLIFYHKQKYNYVISKKVVKRGEAFVSTMNGMTCVYDSFTNMLEFYDMVNIIGTNAQIGLRSVYTHNGCTGMSWSDSGLYVATYVVGDGNCLVHIFNCNGKLVYKRTFKDIRSFQWRHYIKLTEAQKVAIGPVPALMYSECDLDDKKDVLSLLSEWKAYLISKIQSISTE